MQGNMKKKNKFGLKTRFQSFYFLSLFCLECLLLKTNSFNVRTTKDQKTFLNPHRALIFFKINKLLFAIIMQ